MTETVLIIDFGSQVTQLIARRVREAGVYSEIVPFNNADGARERLSPKAVILSGGPASVTEMGTPRAPEWVFDAGVPVLGICYGEQTMVEQLGGTVEAGHHREFGRAELEITKANPLFDGIWQPGEKHQVWMSHGDRVTALPDGFEVVGVSSGAPFAAIADPLRRLYAVQFHPEVVHTTDGAKLLANFVHRIAGLAGDWTMAHFHTTAVEEIRAQVGTGRVICGLSGGVDSSVAAVLIHEAIGDQLTCIFVDHGLMRQGEADEVVSLFRGHYNIPLVHVDASETFIGELAGVTDPEQKRKTIGRLFIETFEAEASKLGGAEFLAQGTLYPDVIESVSFTGGPSVTIKSHHNVGGLPERMNLKLLEPLRELFKDEVRNLGRELGLPETFVGRHPFPRRHHPREIGYPAPGRRHLPRRDQEGRALRRNLAGFRRPVAGQDRRRHGGRAHLRPCLRAARCYVDRRYDRRLFPIPARGAGPHGDAHHQRSARYKSRGLRHHLEAARHYRVGMKATTSRRFVPPKLDISTISAISTRPPAWRCGHRLVLFT
jgi:GMP synthase (glutamine-hydrolysing)